MVSTCCHAKPSLNIQMCGMRIEAAGGQKVTVFEEHVHSCPSHGIESCNEKTAYQDKKLATPTRMSLLESMLIVIQKNTRTAQTHVRKQRTMSGTIVANKHGP